MAKAIHLKHQYRHIAQGEQEITKIWETKKGKKLTTFSIQNPDHNYTALFHATDDGTPKNGELLAKIPGRHHKKILQEAGYQPKES